MGGTQRLCSGQASRVVLLGDAFELCMPAGVPVLSEIRNLDENSRQPRCAEPIALREEVYQLYEVGSYRNWMHDPRKGTGRHSGTYYRSYQPVTAATPRERLALSEGWVAQQQQLLAAISHHQRTGSATTANFPWWWNSSPVCLEVAEVQDYRHGAFGWDTCGLLADSDDEDDGAEDHRQRLLAVAPQHTELARRLAAWLRGSGSTASTGHTDGHADGAAGGTIAAEEALALVRTRSSEERVRARAVSFV